MNMLPSEVAILEASWDDEWEKKRTEEEKSDDEDNWDEHISANQERG